MSSLCRGCRGCLAGGFVRLRECKLADALLTWVLYRLEWVVTGERVGRCLFRRRFYSAG